MSDREPNLIREKFHPILKRCSLLSDFTSEEMNEFLKRVRLEGFTAGEEILTEGHQYHGIWIVLQGTCEVVKHGSRKDSRLAILEPGSVFGEMSFLQEAPHSASVFAVDHVETMRLMTEQYQDLRRCCPEVTHKIAINIISVLSDRLRKMDEWTCELVEKDSNGQRHKEWQDFRSKLYSNLFE